MNFRLEVDDNLEAMRQIISTKTRGAADGVYETLSKRIKELENKINGIHAEKPKSKKKVAKKRTKKRTKK